MKFNIKCVISILLALAICIPQISAKEVEKDSKSAIAKRKAAAKNIKTAEAQTTDSATKDDKRTKGVVTPIETNTPTTTDLKDLIINTPTTVAPLAGEQINWQVLSSGGVVGSSTNYIMNSVIGQTAVGLATSTNFIVNSGFLQNFGGGGCCVGTAGDINNDGGAIPDISDLLYLVDFMFLPPGAAPEPVCMAEADINGDGGAIPDISDLLFLVDFMFLPPGAAPAPAACL